jgi:16S rRNA (guanine527-N7)-methyltransferase
MSTPGGRRRYRELLANDVGGAQLEALAHYAELLERWAGTHNLVRFSSPEELVRRHLIEALAAAPLLAEQGFLVDVGSGAGLPGIPLLVVKPGWRGLLVEPRQKRWAFLSHVIRELGLAAEAAAARYQELAGGAFDVVTVRALGSYPQLLEWARPRLAEGGAVLIWTTDGGESELSALPGWRVVSFRLPASRHGRLAQLHPCST